MHHRHKANRKIVLAFDDTVFLSEDHESLHLRPHGNDHPTTIFELIDDFAAAPENSYSVTLDYRRPLSNGELGFNVSYGWQDKVWTSVNVTDTTRLDDYGLMGAALSWSDIQIGNMPGSMRAMLWGRNLTDEEYGLTNTGAWSTFGASEVQTFGDPQTYGVTLSYLY